MAQQIDPGKEDDGHTVGLGRIRPVRGGVGWSGPGRGREGRGGLRKGEGGRLGRPGKEKDMGCGRKEWVAAQGGEMFLYFLDFLKS